MYRKSNHVFFLPNNTEIKTQKSRLQYFKRLQKAKSVQTQKKEQAFLALDVYNFELCVKNQQMDRACQKLNPKIESKGGRVTKNKPELDFDFRMWVHLAWVVEGL